MKITIKESPAESEIKRWYLIKIDSLYVYDVTIGSLYELYVNFIGKLTASMP